MFAATLSNVRHLSSLGVVYIQHTETRRGNARQFLRTSQDGEPSACPQFPTLPPSRSARGYHSFLRFEPAIKQVLLNGPDGNERISRKKIAHSNL